MNARIPMFTLAAFLLGVCQVGAADLYEQQPMKRHAIESPFGRAVVDTDKPGLRELWLRQPDGTLAPKNLLSLHAPARDG